MINHKSVQAYLSWLAKKENKEFFLPNENQWEKAARGVDGRLYPWGDHFDPSYCCAHESHKGIPYPAPTNSFAIDTSVYGVSGMADNFHDMTSSSWQRSLRHVPEEHLVTIRGGSLFSNKVRTMIPAPTFLEKLNCSGGVGFRLTRKL